jgi:hypothetical protein
MDFCRWPYSGLRGVIYPGGGVQYEGARHGMRLRDVIDVMVLCIAIRDICRGLYGGLKGQYLSVGAVTIRSYFNVPFLKIYT